jgi:stage II sporulation protein D
VSPRSISGSPSRFHTLRRGLRRVAVGLALAAALEAAPATLKIRVGSSNIDVPIERYVAAALAGESSGFRSDAALKAMAVAARTFAIRFRGRHATEGYDLCATTHCQHVDLSAITPRFEAIAQATAGELLWFQGKPATAWYSSDCGGFTEDANAIWPGLGASYLVRHPDPFCQRAGGGSWQWRISPKLVSDVLGRAQLHGPAVLEHISISQRTASGRVRELLLTGDGESVRISASTFRFAMGRAMGWNSIRSDRYTIADHGLLLQGSGSGHGVGLCQLGADQMGVEGHSYREILAFYYPGTVLGLNARGLSWTRLGGEAVVLLTTRPDQDRIVLATAERQARSAGVRDIEIRSYPDVDTFRDATGEPGWVAAYTDVRRIHLQPMKERSALENTLRHEVFHVMVESRTRANLPLWFREGLVEWLSGERPRVRSIAPIRPADAEMRQRVDPERARRAYAAATMAVASLVSRYGEGTVMSWLGAGLPREVRIASASPVITSSR